MKMRFMVALLVVTQLFEGCTWTNGIPKSELPKLNGFRAASASRKVRNDEGEEVAITGDDELTLHLKGNLRESHRFVSIDVDDAFAGVTIEGQKVRVPLSFIDSISVEKGSAGKTTVEVLLVLLLAVPALLLLIAVSSIKG